MAGRCGSPAHRSVRWSRETAETFPAKHALRLGEVLPLSSGNSESMAKRSLACSLVTPSAGRACHVEAQAAAEAASTDD